MTSCLLRGGASGSICIGTSDFVGERELIQVPVIGPAKHVTRAANDGGYVHRGGVVRQPENLGGFPQNAPVYAHRQIALPDCAVATKSPDGVVVKDE